MLKPFLRLFRHVRRLERENRRLNDSLDLSARFQPPGHYYSPLPSREEIAAAFSRGNLGEPFEGIDLNEPEQIAMLDAISRHYPELPYPERATPGWRYHLDNPSYGVFDVVCLHGMIRHLNPGRIIEVGSGYSSAAMLDLNEHALSGRMHLTFIDPDLTRLRALLSEGGSGEAELIEQKVQDVPVELFSHLNAGDILFIDSSHVSKIGSDLNHLFFRVLPVLKPGVHIHIHDIAWNLEYPREWLEEGRAWNEQYFLRAFLMYNAAFRIAFFSAWMFHRHNSRVLAEMPRCGRGGGGQIWLRRAE